MPLLVGGSAALVALAAGILAHVDPLASLGRAGLALILGWVGANLWYVLTSATRPAPMIAVEPVLESAGEPGTS